VLAEVFLGELIVGGHNSWADRKGNAFNERVQYIILDNAHALFCAGSRRDFDPASCDYPKSPKTPEQFRGLRPVGSVSFWYPHSL